MNKKRKDLISSVFIFMIEIFVQMCALLWRSLVKPENIREKEQDKRVLAFAECVFATDKLYTKN